MGKQAIDDLAVVISASTDQLGGDLRRAAAMFDKFSKEIGRNSPDLLGAKTSSLDFAGIKKAAHTAGVRASQEFGRSFKSIKDAVSLPSKAMIQGGTGAALADPFILATAAADTFAAAAEVPFKLIAAGAHMVAATIAIPFQIAGMAVEGLTGAVGGLLPVAGGVLSGIGKVAGSTLQFTGQMLSGLASGVGTAFGAMGDVVGKVFSGIAKVGIQSVAIAFQHVKESVNLAAEMEQNKISFDVLIGSATKATEVLAGLRKFAAETPFSQKDVTGGGKQLLGYGVSADQLVPSIKMLGDVSSATGKPLTELVYLYGTLINQDRAYLVDIKQFATAGIPIYQELAKVLHVTEDRMREMVESGKVGIPEVQKAFINMTSAGGRFHGMMEQQATSFAGIREQMSDAWEIGKAKLGQAVIEELGLKDAAKDVTRFIESIHSKIDDIRPAIRFMGDLGRSVASAGMEFVRAAGQIATINFNALASSFPEVFAAVKKSIADLGTFQLNPEGIIKAGFDMARGLVTGLDTAFKWAETKGKAYYKDFKSNFLDPIAEFASGLKEALELLNEINPFNGNFKRGLNELGKDNGVVGMTKEGFVRHGYDEKAVRQGMMGADSTEARRFFPAAVDDAIAHKERFGPRAAGEHEEDFATRYRQLNANLEMAAHLAGNLGMSDYKAKADQLAELRLKNFIHPYGTDFEKVNRSLNYAVVPPLRPGYEPQKPVTDDVIGRLNTAESIVLSGIATRKAADEATRLTTIASSALTKSFTDLVASAFGLETSFTKVAEVITKFDPWGSDVMGSAKKAREEHGIDPLQGIANEFALLQKNAAIGAINFAGDLGLTGGLKNLPGGIDAGTYGRATTALGERAESMVGTHRLPDAMLRDSTESVRVLSNWESGNGQQTATSLLQQILDQLKEQNHPRSQMGADAIGKTIADLLPIVIPLGAV